MRPTPGEVCSPRWCAYCVVLLLNGLLPVRRNRECEAAVPVVINVTCPQFQRSGAHIVVSGRSSSWRKCSAEMRKQQGLVEAFSHLSEQTGHCADIIQQRILCKRLGLSVRRLIIVASWHTYEGKKYKSICVYTFAAPNICAYALHAKMLGWFSPAAFEGKHFFR